MPSIGCRGRRCIIKAPPNRCHTTLCHNPPMSAKKNRAPRPRAYVPSFAGKKCYIYTIHKPLSGHPLAKIESLITHRQQPRRHDIKPVITICVNLLCPTNPLCSSYEATAKYKTTAHTIQLLIRLKKKKQNTLTLRICRASPERSTARTTRAAASSPWTCPPTSAESTAPVTQ